MWPGLGQLYLGHRQAALVYAAPLVIAVGVLVASAVGGLERLGLALLSPSVALTVAVLIGLLGAWRLLSMADAFLSAGGRRELTRHPRRLGFVAVLVLVVVAVHGVGLWYAWSFYEAGSRIFVAEPNQDNPSPIASASLSEGLSDFPEATPIATPPSASARINVLLIGTDWAPTRNHSLTDTLLVVSIDPAGKSAVMVSLPRDLARFPLSDGRTYQGKINSLLAYAESHRSEFPDGGMTTLVREVGYLVGVPIHYYAAINLPGFEAMIDAVGGVRVYNEKPISDPFYVDWRDPSRRGFSLSVGWHTLDGQTALAFVRSRQGVGNNDFERARRQQQLLIALRDKLTDPTMLPKIPGLLQAAGNTIRTNFPAERLPDMLDLGRQIGSDSIARKVLGPPYATRATDTSIYMLVPDMAAFARVSIELFGSDSRYAGASSTP
ncbi:MAG TPA: LCP family protein [Candidatus Binatia bacterium]|nr:LCP family protein [Candidatus Binatia bacterium]